MVFDSLTFVLFLALMIALHALPLPWTARKAILLGGSYVFYGAWNPPFVLLLLVSTVVDYTAARAIDRCTTRRARTAWLVLSLCGNFGFLGWFKYGGFLTENAVMLAAAAGIDWRPPEFDVVLPVGISFYTFQTVSYVIDVYRGEHKPARSLLDFSLYVSFFPQLVAGPIVRATDFLPQLAIPRQATRAQLGWGLALIVLGLFQKTVLADGVFAGAAERVYDSGDLLAFGSAWIGTLAFAGQIFCDFAGYSTCAIGCALCLGFHLVDNFRFPYAALGFSDFWRRWHRSLSSWLRDYLYIPLGGNRGGSVRTGFNLMLTMLLGGLWHGASWTFVAWGGLHGLYLILERWLRAATGFDEHRARLPTRVCVGVVTFVGVCFAWVFFRARTFDRAADVTLAMLGLGPDAPRLHPTGQAALVLAGITGVLCVHAAMRERTLESVAARAPTWLLALLVGLMLLAVVASPGEDRAFIYFQF